MKVLAIVPARCGSKGFPNKNIALINNKTLLELAIKVAIDCPDVDDTFVSTDCIEYEKIAKKSGAKSIGLRSKTLATDNAKTVDVIIDLIKKLENKYTHIVLLQPTSPNRTPSDISEMIKLMTTNDADAIVSLTKLEEPHPYKLKKINELGLVEPFLDGTDSELPRQSLPMAYSLNGAIYIVKVDTLLKEKTFLPEKTVPYIMKNNINIDREDDFFYLLSMLTNAKINIYGV